MFIFNNMDILLYILIFWLVCGLLGSLIQLFKSPKAHRELILFLYMVLFGLLFGPIYLIASITNKTVR